MRLNVWMERYLWCLHEPATPSSAGPSRPLNTHAPKLAGENQPQSSVSGFTEDQLDTEIQHKLTSLCHEQLMLCQCSPARIAQATAMWPIPLLLGKIPKGACHVLACKVSFLCLSLSIFFQSVRRLVVVLENTIKALRELESCGLLWSG